MNIENLDANTTLKLVGLAPIELVGNCNGYIFTIIEVDDGYQLTGPNHLSYTYTLKEALQESYLAWGYEDAPDSGCSCRYAIVP